MQKEIVRLREKNFSLTNLNFSFFASENFVPSSCTLLTLNDPHLFRTDLQLMQAAFCRRSRCACVLLNHSR